MTNTANTANTTLASCALLAASRRAAQFAALVGLAPQKPLHWRTPVSALTTAQLLLYSAFAN